MDPISLEDREKHLVLYAKDWYHSTVMMEDLKMILSRFNRVDVKYINNAAVFSCVLALFHKVTNIRQQEIFWGDIFHRVQKPSVMMKELIGLLLGRISICKVRENDQVLIDLGEPDYTILPPP